PCCDVACDLGEASAQPPDAAPSEKQVQQRALALGQRSSAPIAEAHACERRERNGGATEELSIRESRRGEFLEAADEKNDAGRELQRQREAACKQAILATTHPVHAGRFDGPYRARPARIDGKRH